MAVDRGAIPYDAPEVKFGHRDGKCSFETILEAFGLTDGGLLRLAEIVHAADIAADRQKDSIAPGLEAIASGFSLILPDDQANLAAQFPLYDALYAWCRLQVAKK